MPLATDPAASIPAPGAAKRKMDEDNCENQDEKKAKTKEEQERGVKRGEDDW